MSYLATIVIPTMFSNLDYLRECLVSLGQLKFDPAILHPKVEVLVVCNSSEAKMLEVQASLTNSLKTIEGTKKTFRLDIHWLCLGFNTGFVGATNAGIQASQAAGAEYVIFLNDDTQVTPLWLSELVLTQRRTRADMIASKVYLGDKKTLDSQGFGFSWRGKAEALNQDLKCSLSNDSDYWLNQPNLLNQKDLTEPFGPDGAAAMYTQKLFKQIGLLEKDFFAYLEDVDLALRARQHGLVCALAEKAIIYHYKHATSSKFSSFKSRQDLINWGKIVKRRYNSRVLKKFAIIIFIERLKNLSGFLKSKYN